MNGKQAKAIRRIYGDNKKAARYARKVRTRAGTELSQMPKFRNVSPDVAIGRAGNGKPDAMAPHASPLRAIFQIADGNHKVARHLIANELFPMDFGRDPIKFLSHGPRTRANAVLRQLKTA